jgi:uncharacterized membrane-anchored protein
MTFILFLITAVPIVAFLLFMFSNILGRAIGVALGDVLTKAFSAAFSSFKFKKGG